MRDELWQVKCLYSTGAYQAAINTANQIQTTTLNSLKLFYICRCYLAQKKFSLVINELKSAGEPMLKAVLAYAKYLSTSTKSSSITDRKKLLDEMMQLLEQSGQSQIAQLAAELLIGDGDYKAAAECLAPHLSTDIECRALLIVVLLKMGRKDVAGKQLELMKAVSEDAPVTQLCEAWIDLNSGKYQEAYYIFQELQDTLGVSSKLLAGKATSKMLMGELAEAEKLLMESLNLTNDDSETLANLVVCGRQDLKPAEAIQRYLAQLKDSCPEHRLVVQSDLKSSLFDRISNKFMPQ